MPNIGKVFEIVINMAINKFCDKNNIIPEYQFGFRHKHSTIHGITKFPSDVCWGLNSGDCVGASLIELEKAFETIWIRGLIFKLSKKNFPIHMIKLIWNMIQNRSFKTTDGTKTSTREYILENGLQQGTVNSPILFNIYNSDILFHDSINIKPKRKALAFADDLIIYSRAKKVIDTQEELQNMFRKVQLYCNN